MKAYFDKYKHIMFPEIKDWTKDDPLKLKKKKFKDIKSKEWFYFDTLPYNLVTFGGPGFFVLNFGILITYFIIKQKYGMLIFPVIFFIIVSIQLIFKIKNWRFHRQMTFYEQYMKEYKIEKT